MNNVQQDVSVRHQNQQQSALQNTIQDSIILPRNNEQYDMLTFFANTQNEIKDFLFSRLIQHGIKWYLSVQMELIKKTQMEILLLEVNLILGV
jgi:hypothetical protein